jgi:hypothetical protein
MTPGIRHSRTPAAAPASEAGSSSPWRLPWNELLDGRLRRFKRGVHYSGLAEAVEEEARNAAEELGKTAITFRDDMEVFEYVWVQFVDGTLEEGDPCPKCANTAFEKHQEYFVRCTACRSLFALTQPKPVRPPPEKPPAVGEFVTLRLLSADGNETGEISVLEELKVELICSFHRPIWAVHAAFVFRRGGKRMLHTGSPAVIQVPEPETVRFDVRVPPGLLTPGHYDVSPAVRIIRDEDTNEVEHIKVQRPAKKLHIFDARGKARRHLPAERSKLAWEAKGASGEAMPVSDEWLPGGDAA